MSLPSSWGTVRVYGTYTLRDGEPAVGSVIFHSPQIVVVGGVTIVPRNIVCELDEDGFFEYDLPSTDDPDIAPDGWVYTVRERFDGGGGRAAYEISVPLAGGDINLATVAPAISVDEKSALELWQLADVHDDAEDPDNNDVLVWNDTTKRWVPSASVPGSATWGGITGTLSDQADLQAALDAKAPLSSPTFTGTPAAPTAAGGTSTTQIATTAFVGSAVSTHAGATDPHGDRAYTDTQIAGRQAASATLTTLSSATAAGLALMDDATAADQRTTLGLGTAATHNVPASGDAASGEVVKGNDTRLDVAATVHAATAASLADADEQGFWQSASSALRKISWANVKAAIKTYADTLYAAISHTHAASAIDSGTLDAARLPAPTTTALGGVKRNTGSAGQYVTGIDTDGSLLRDTPAGGGGTKTIAVFIPNHNQPPASGFATLDTRNSVLVLDFDDASVESALFGGVIPEAASLTSGLVVSIRWMATSATTGNVRWRAEFEADGTDLDSDSFATATEATGAANGTSGIETTTEITCTTIDSLAAGDRYRLKVSRVGNDGTNDTMSGDAELVAVELRAA